MQFIFISQDTLIKKDFFCENCVPRGCNCNVYHINEFPFNCDPSLNYIFWDEQLEKYIKKHTNKTVYYEIVDEKWRRYPCCEYDYSEDGYDEEDFK